MNTLKVKTSAACLMTVAILAGACEEEHDQLGPPLPALGGAAGSGGGTAGEENIGGEGGILINGEVPTCLEGD
jgi:hypothetical protein